MTEAIPFGRNVSIGCGGIIVPSQGVLLTINGIRFLKSYVLLVTFQLRAMPTTRPKTLCLKLIPTFFIACFCPPPRPPSPPGSKSGIKCQSSLSLPPRHSRHSSSQGRKTPRHPAQISAASRAFLFRQPPPPPTQHSRPLRPPLYGGAGVSVEKGYFYVIKEFFTYSHSFETKTDNYMPSLIFLKSRNCF